MLDRLQSTVAMLARVLLCLIFLNSAYGKITNWGGTAAYMEARGMPAPQMGLPVAVVAEILGALALLVGFRARLGAVVLIAFLIPATLYFHNFWTFPEDQVRGQMIHFMKNITIIGGLLMVLAYGGGSLGVDGWLRRRQKRSTSGKQS